MNIKFLGIESDGTRSVEISCNELSFRALIRSIRKIPGAVVTDVSHNPMNDDTFARVQYKEALLTLETPFSDYIINCKSPNSAFDEFVAKLREQRVKWWEKVI